MGYALTSVLPTWLRRTVGGAAEQSSYWQAFRQAARATAYYRSADFVERRRVALAAFYREHAQFLNPHAPTPDPVVLESPWDAPVKTVALQPWFRIAPPVETRVDRVSLRELHRGLDVLAAPIDMLLEMAAAGGEFATPPVHPGYGVLAFTGVSRTPFSEALRDRLWRVFQAPVFEQFRGFQGELLGAECEAFEGLHFDPDRVVWEEAAGGTLLLTSLSNLRHPAWRLESGRQGAIERARCRCGSELPRVLFAR